MLHPYCRDRRSCASSAGGYQQTSKPMPTQLHQQRCLQILSLRGPILNYSAPRLERRQTWRKLRRHILTGVLFRALRSEDRTADLGMVVAFGRPSSPSSYPAGSKEGRVSLLGPSMRTFIEQKQRTASPFSPEAGGQQVRKKGGRPRSTVRNMKDHSQKQVTPPSKRPSNR